MANLIFLHDGACWSGFVHAGSLSGIAASGRDNACYKALQAFYGDFCPFIQQGLARLTKILGRVVQTGDCTAQFIHNMFYGVTVLRSCRLLHLGGIALLEEIKDYPSTVRDKKKIPIRAVKARACMKQSCRTILNKARYWWGVVFRWAPVDLSGTKHDNVIKWTHFVGGIHRSPVNSPHKGQWRGAFMFSLICARINARVNNSEAGDLRRIRTHYDVIVMVPVAACSVGCCWR